MRTWRQKRPGLLIVVAILILLLPLLAYLQYDWLGKVSEREREQMQTALRRTLRQFRQDFDREIARTFLQFEPTTEHTDKLGEEYAKVYAHWISSAPYPKLIRDIFLEAPPSNDVKTLQRLNPSSRKWEPADWVTEFGPRGQLASPVDGKIPALVIPIARVSNLLPVPKVLAFASFPETGKVAHNEVLTPHIGRLIVRLNLEYIQKEFLPTLVRSHFAEPAADYKLQVSDGEDRSRVIYSSDAGAVLHGDAVESILGLRLTEFHVLMPAGIAIEHERLRSDIG